MRISVCEFLRLMTTKNWFYRNPGHWVSDGGEYEAKREDPRYPDEIYLYKGKRQLKTLTYFEGQPSNVVRKRNKGY